MSQHNKIIFNNFDKTSMDEGLRLHHLVTDKPSQLSDAFRSGADWGASYAKNNKTTSDTLSKVKIFYLNMFKHCKFIFPKSTFFVPVPGPLDMRLGTRVMTIDGPGEFRDVTPNGSYAIKLDSAPNQRRAYDKVELINNTK